MKARVLALLLLRIAGVYLLVEGAASAVSGLAHVMEGREWDMLNTALVARGGSALPQWIARIMFLFTSGRVQFAVRGGLAIPELIAGTVLLLKAGPISAWLAGDPDVSESSADDGPGQAIAFSIAGCYFLFTGLAHLTGVGYALLAKPKWDETMTLEYLLDRANVHLGTAIAYSLGGAILLLYRAGLSGAVARAWRVVRSRQD